MARRTAVLARSRRAHAAVVGVLLAALALGGCGSGDAAGDHRFGTFTDCASIGSVTRSADPAGDQRGLRKDGPQRPDGDLLAVGLSRGGDRLCAEFRTRAPIESGAAFVVTLRPQDADGPVVLLEATVLPGSEPEAMLDAQGRGDRFRKVDGDVGIRGDRLSIVVARRVFAQAGVAAVFDRFRYQARSAAVLEGRASASDCAPSCR